MGAIAAQAAGTRRGTRRGSPARHVGAQPSCAFQEGGLDLELASAHGVTCLARVESRAPLRVLRTIRADPTLPGMAEIPLVHLGGGLLEGEHLRVTVAVRAGALARFTTVGATHLYPMPGGGQARQDVHLEVEVGGLAEWLPEPLIPHAGARYRQQVVLTAHAGARIFFAETLVAGRHDGEAFAFAHLRLRTELRAATGELLAVDALTLEPASSPCALPGAFGPYRALGSALLVTGPGEIEALERILTLLPFLAPAGAAAAAGGEDAPPLLGGCSRLPGGAGLAVRLLGRGGAEAVRGLHDVWRAWRQAVFGAAPDPSRSSW